MDDIGKILKETRESKNLTLDEISKETHILTRYLSAVEEGNYSIVPDRIYVIGIIRKYADFLGLDGSQLVKSFVDSVNRTAKITVQKTDKVSRHSDGINLRPLITILTSVVLIAAFVAILYINPYKNFNIPQPLAPAPQEEQMSPVNPPPEIPKVEEPQVADKLVMTIKFTGEC
ncbi:MAG: helix-turn-helix domain-containing protein [Thermoanaerobacteraceae bacterium]|nr:helix-turn-helix domain-containing protein [Thermoanaerobacteraceae bacterium]